MSKIVDAVKALDPTKPYFSYEFFPPKTTSGTENLYARIERMATFKPMFVAVTWGAGGSTAEKSLALAAACRNQAGLDVCLHLTCTNMDKEILDSALTQAREHNVKNILALRGDPPRGEEYWSSSSNEFHHAVDLVKYIKKTHGDFFCIGVAGYPEGHVDGVDTSGQDALKDIPFLVEKVRAGADFIITQVCYDTSKLIAWEKALREHESGVFNDILILPGLMPINTYQSFLRTAKLSHASIPSELLAKLDEIPVGDDDKVKQLGVEVLINMISDIFEKTERRVRGFHFYTLNLEKSVALVLEKSKVLALSRNELTSLPDASGPAKKTRRSSSLNVDNKIIVDEIREGLKNMDFMANAVDAGNPNIERTFDDALAISTGEGELGREATWDDFPNGRFGDSRSPAYGEIDGYGPSLHIDNAKAYKIWGYPVTPEDISNLIIKHICGKIEAIPWSDVSLSPETSLIQEELIQLNEKGYFTVSSQPATNSSKSNDKIFGWGPKNGYVFQKAFVEFFISANDWRKLKARIDNFEDVISYYASTSKNGFESNLASGSANAVTWGVFPNREILQSTIIEEESFKAWSEEAFSIWREWQRLYPKGTASYKLLDNIFNNYHLVTIVNHDYIDTESLWSVLLE
ncbi:methylenetetrahydrofolate reduct [Nadsonia fulvescens var. elongata DSM 6958]|uniref:Methylenetetrahydrofolate reduct n=1 Tax=Nadsonia fulvescens var. elongata DSM 6958 TaxID=857566 RepID=A0A1E3PKC7_9ASCO|nr:methylenetetrahydrofolate reduct [Nadsonia fulvescens var. elongata DSM 6958]